MTTNLEKTNIPTAVTVKPVLFGHRFIRSKGGYVWPSEYCYRCGKKKGEDSHGKK